MKPLTLIAALLTSCAHAAPFIPPMPPRSSRLIRTDGDIACQADFGSSTMGSGPERQAQN